jgi:hypothetical protein
VILLSLSGRWPMRKTTTRMPTGGLASYLVLIGLFFLPP